MAVIKENTCKHIKQFHVTPLLIIRSQVFKISLIPLGRREKKLCLVWGAVRAAINDLDDLMNLLRARMHAFNCVAIFMSEADSNKYFYNCYVRQGMFRTNKKLSSR